MPRNNTFLVIAESGRALADSARKAGYRCHIIDRFGDEDCVPLGLSHSRVNAGEDGLDTLQLAGILETFRGTDLAGIVTGGGLEMQPGWLEDLSTEWPLFANDAGTVRDCKQPECLFPLLDEAGIVHPEIAFKAVDSRGKWLQKRIGASGGRHIRSYRSGKPVMQGYYLQRRMEGRPFSAVFLADGTRANLVGVSETRCIDVSKDDFRYRGAVSLAGLQRDLLAPFAELVTVVTKQLSLKGLCGLDTIVDPAGRIYVLEVNPRPTATFPLFENEESLFSAHVRAIQGKLPSHEGATSFRAHEVIYNDRNGAMPGIDWPEWVTDRPAAGAQLAAGQPLCTVHAAADSLAAVKKLLAKRVERFRQLAGSMELLAA